MRQLFGQRGFVVLVEVVYLFILFAIAGVYFFARGHGAIPDYFGPLPTGVLWFGALGAIIISLSGAFDHRQDWDPTWNLWHYTRPLVGMSLAIIAWAIFQSGILAVGATPSPDRASAPTNILFYIIAFVVGYREDVFRSLIKRVADVILTPGGSSTGAAPTVTSMNPTGGTANGGQTVTITGSGLSGATQVRFGSAVAAELNVASDRQLTVTAPAGAGAAAVTIVTANGTAAAGNFTYT